MPQEFKQAAVQPKKQRSSTPPDSSGNVDVPSPFPIGFTDNQSLPPNVADIQGDGHFIRPTKVPRSSRLSLSTIHTAV
jgi:hypothetical protein